jgi:hypothetical protein
VELIPGLIEGIDAARIRRDVDELAGFHTRHVASGDTNIGAAVRYLRSRFDEAGQRRLKVYLDTFDQEVSRLEGRRLSMSNVVAELAGAEATERLIVVGGHYDSRVNDISDSGAPAPGANDNASGVALTLELARVLSQQSWPCTLVFIAFTAEEMGLLGARNWAQGARSRGRDVIAMLNNDMVGNTRDFQGRVCDDRTRVFSEGLQAAGDTALLRRLGLESDSPSRQLARYVAEMGARFLPRFGVDLVMRPDRLGRGGDHLPFSDERWPAVRFVEALENYDRQHQALRREDGHEFGDVAEHVNAGYVARIAALNCATMASLALAPAPPVEVALSGPVSHSPRLSWTAVPGLTYAVRARGTSSPLWQDRIEVAGASHFEISPHDVSDRIFAVEAVNARGYRSLPVVAMPPVRG